MEAPIVIHRIDKTSEFDRRYAANAAKQAARKERNAAILEARIAKAEAIAQEKRDKVMKVVESMPADSLGNIVLKMWGTKNELT
jgi:hypothetical protein